MSELPPGWAEVKLGGLVAARIETVDPSSQPDQAYELYSVPSFSADAPELVTGSQIGSVKQKVRPCDVLLCKIVPHLNRVWTVREKAEPEQIASGEWIIYRDHGCDSAYLQRLLSEESFRTAFMQTVSGVGGSLMRARPSAVQEITIPIAPLPEQRRIVAKIDALTARSKHARAELNRRASLNLRLRRSILEEAFSGPETSTVGEILTSIRGGKNLRCVERPPREGEIGVIKVSAVTWGRFDPRQSKTLPDSFKPDPQNRIRAGDLLFSRANTLDLVGACVLVEAAPNNLYLSDKVLRLEVADDAKSWLLWFLRSPQGRRQLEQGSSGNQMSMRNISQEALRSVTLPVPGKYERDRIVARIETAFAALDRVEAEAKAAERALDRLDQAILAKAFRGELVPQDPADEPASALLARIAAERARAPKPARGRRKAPA